MKLGDPIVRQPKSLRTADAVEKRSPRCAKGRAAIRPLLGGEGRGEGELWDLCSSSRAPNRAAWSGVLSLFGKCLPATLTVVVALTCATIHAGDWPQFLGPTRDGVYAGSSLATEWPTDGPPALWKKDVGQGFSGPVVAAGKLILFHRVDDKETVECLEGKSGKGLWKFDYATAYHDDFGFDEGPRATTAIAEGRVYTCGA